MFFRQLGKNQYAIISAFVKKADKTASIENRLRRMARMYNGKKVQNLLNNPEFLTKNIKYTYDLKKLLVAFKYQNINIDSCTFDTLIEIILLGPSFLFPVSCFLFFLFF